MNCNVPSTGEPGQGVRSGVREPHALSAHHADDENDQDDQDKDNQIEARVRGGGAGRRPTPIHLTMRNISRSSAKEMRIFSRLGQPVLLLAVGMLAGAASVGVVMSRDGLPASLAGFGKAFAPPEGVVPATIEIRSPAAQPGAQTSGQAQAGQSPSSSTAAPGQLTKTPGAVIVVTPPVYAYPPDDHGHDRGGGGDGHH